ncbi:hypothetical protein C8J57DRAFT_180321 [Mycena rebaudengoi]|nr:hypothetical protein C8J57DRAFT_180321 [Mycena rebaudengoi]
MPRRIGGRKFNGIHGFAIRISSRFMATASSSGIHAAVFHDDLVPAKRIFDKYCVSHFATVYLWNQLETEFTNAYYYMKSYSETALVSNPSNRHFCIFTNLGWTVNKAQFMTVPVYAVTLVLELLVACSSDRFKERPFHVAAPECKRLEFSQNVSRIRYTRTQECALNA